MKRSKVSFILLLIIQFICLFQLSASGPLGSSTPETKNRYRRKSSATEKAAAGDEFFSRFRAGSLVDSVLAPPLALTSSHCMPVSDCLDSLQTSENNGLSSLEAALRLQRYGSNVLAEPPKKSIFRLIFEQFDDRLVQILLAVAVLSSGLAAVDKDPHAFTEPTVIISILLVNSIVGVLQSRSAENSLEALKKLQPTTTCVLRDGSWIGNFPTQSLVPGDIIYLRVGDKVPADARIIYLKTNTFSTDEGSLTGESASVSKSIDSVDVSATLSSKNNMVFSGTLVSGGACYAVVVGTGAATEIGMINAGVQAAREDQGKTPLAEKLDKFGNDLTKLIGAICLGVWLMSIPKFKHEMFSSWMQGAIYYAKTAVALGVAAIPEGLPAVITLCLSLGTRRMAKKNVIVRKLSSVETLGCTTVICTDKTGTLTTNKMTVKSMVTFSKDKYISGSSARTDDSAEFSESEGGGLIRAPSPSGISLTEHHVEGVSYEPVGRVEGITETTMQSNALQKFALICTLCNEAQLEIKDGKFSPIGEPTEAALKVLVEKLGVPGIVPSNDPHQMIRQCNDHWASQYAGLSILEFSRSRKSMSVLVRPTHPDNRGHRDNLLLVKGAAEMVVSRCSKLMLRDGSTINIDSRLRQELNSQLSELARRPLRCLAMAFKSGDALGDLNKIKTVDEAASSDVLKDPSTYEDVEKDLVLVGLCGIKDPARPEAAEAINKCRKAGIRVMMITGDSKETAVAIAKEVNIFSHQDDVSTSAFTGSEFFELREEEQLELLRSGNKVFCRTEPRDKQRLISMLEKLEEIPAMTGDGVNDAPALKQAAIGIAMGITGTEVAKGAADMILADDNFSTIVSAVEEGRNIYANMQAFVCFLISCNIGEIVTIFLATLLGFPEPLTPLHLLWVNLVTDGPPATALGFNPADPKVMDKPPRSRHESLLSRWLLTRYAITGLYVGAATVGAFLWWYLDKGVTLGQLSTWGQCPTWGVFAHSAEAPNWPTQPCNIFTGDHLMKPQTISLSVLVVIEMLKALSAVSLDNSMLKIKPWQNKWLMRGVALPVLLHIAVLYVPFLSRQFGLTPLSLKEWKVVLLFSLPVILLEEILKYFGRKVASDTEAKNRNKFLRNRLPPPMF